jgi:hypothetical protein
MKNMGVKEKNTLGAVNPTPKSKIQYPSVSFSSKALPDIKDMKMHDEGEMKIKYKVKGLRQGYDDKSEINCEMDILGCEILDGGDDFKEARRRNLDRKTYDELKGKGNAGKK